MLQALALGAGCQSTKRVVETHRQQMQRADVRVVTAAQCAQYDPNGARCEHPADVCAGNVACNWNCPSGPGTCPPPRCGMHRWSCLCTAGANDANDLRWSCNVEMRPAGPQPPPELPANA